MSHPQDCIAAFGDDDHECLACGYEAPWLDPAYSVGVSRNEARALYRTPEPARIIALAFHMSMPLSSRRALNVAPESQRN